MVLLQTILGQISIAPGQTDHHPGKKEKLSNKQQQKRHVAKRVGHPECRRAGEGKSLTTSWLEKAGTAAHAQQPGVGKLVKAVVGGKLHRRGGRPTSHMSCK
jgi:hypothetical protein